MKLKFLNRSNEQIRIRSFIDGPAGCLAVVYGRRRCGKSTLLQNAASPADLYFLADPRDASLQIQALAVEAGRLFPEFATANYRSWDDLLRALHARVDGRLNLLLDEFPYLVSVSPELPGLIQHYIDAPGDKRLNFVLCGSSQRMMQGLVLDRSAPLYGRAQEILKIQPLSAGWIPEALGVQGAEAIEAYAVWGGIPRYWELARDRSSLENAINELVLDPQGVLHEEPFRLLTDDLRAAGQAQSLLSLIGGGCHRLSEIAGRLARPAGSLTRPMANLIELGYVLKDVPFGESRRSGKRTLYRLSDPFLAFYFRFVQPNQSLLELGRLEPVAARVRQDLGGHTAGVWERLARESVPFLRFGGREWGPASRWWGTGLSGQRLEFDIVAESLDRKAVLIGEAKWAEGGHDIGAWLARLRVRMADAPFVKGRSVIPALWVKHRGPPDSGGVETVDPDRVLEALKR